ncbi:MAG: ADP-ribosylglycohydrolase family protein [Opitutaceae bacterium]
MTDLDKRRAGLLFGSFTAEALSLGVHWIYDTKKLSDQFESITEYHAPITDAYHPNKQAGDQSHVGDQALRLADFLMREGNWDKNTFMSDWVAMWPEYNDYFDQATKTTLSNIKRGVMPKKAGSSSSELAGPARIAPLIAYLVVNEEEEEEDVVVKASEQQTELTHNSKEAFEASEFLSTSCYRMLHGADLVKTIESTAPAWALNAIRPVKELSVVDAVAELGKSCSIKSALPSVIHTVLKHGDDLPKAFSENAMAGGDNCTRGLALGMLLGAAHGIDAIPKAWQDGLTAKQQLVRLLKKV